MKQQPTLRWLFLAPVLALSACISLPGVGGADRPQPSVYTLGTSQPEPSNVAARERNRRPPAVVVAKPQLPAGFETDRIALYLDQGRQLDYYADAKWSARLDDLLQEFLVQRAQRNFPGRIVSTPDIAASANYRLALKVTHFEPVYMDAPDKAPHLNVAMTVTVIDLPRESVKAQFSVEKSQAASANRLGTITNELGNLFQSVADEAMKKAAPYLSS